jgi:hypothetical protein
VVDRFNACAGTNTSMGQSMGGMRRGRKATCPVCGRRIAMRPGRAGRLYAHAGTPTEKQA